MRRFFLLLSVMSCSSTPDPTPRQVGIGPFPLKAGEETTLCVVVPLGNTEDVVIENIEVNLAQGSHHLIVYETTAEPTNTPYPCVPFAGIGLGTDVPVFFANKPNATWAFPKGIAQELKANTMLKLEAHYINASTAPIDGRGTITFRTLPKAKAPPYQAANFIFWGTTKISVPAHATGGTGKVFQNGIAGTHFVAVTTHQHRLGTRAQVWQSPNATTLGTQIADDRDWANPAWKTLAPPFDFDGTSGLTFECDWNNTTDQAVHFGESALDEMCFIGGYYYPSHGLDLCINGKCRGRSVN